MTPSLFFITGLPRSRTSWLAMFMTWETSFCFHDETMESKTPEALIARMKSMRAEYVGDSDSGLVFQSRTIRSFVPDAKWVVVQRASQEVVDCLSRVYPDMNSIGDIVQVLIDRLGDTVVGNSPLVVAYQDIDARIVEIAKHCAPNCNWDHKERLDLYKSMLIQPTASKMEQYRNLKVPLTIEEKHQSPALESYGRIIGDFIQDPYALEFVNTVIDTSHLLDHIIDGDYLDKVRAEQAIYTMAVKWPTNAFIRTFSCEVGQVLDASYQDWKSGARDGAFKLYIEVPCFVVQKLSGNKRSDELRELLSVVVSDLEKEDRIKDGD